MVARGIAGNDSFLAGFIYPVAAAVVLKNHMPPALLYQGDEARVDDQAFSEGCRPAIADGRDSEIYYDWVSYANISKEAPLAVVAAEDQLFPDHNGFDFEAMGNALSKNLKGKKLRGASTLSQQVAKNVFLWQSRSYIRKIFEVYFTVLIELIWGKERILEVYLNVAEMGSMTFGVEEASTRYFNTSAKNLTRQQAARIASVLPSPIKWSAAKPGPYVNRRTAAIARQMRALGGVAYINDLRSF